MYKLYDNYDLDMYFIGEYNSLKEFNNAQKEYYDETDGECALYYSKNDGGLKPIFILYKAR